MQKLVWQNANGDSIDLTSGNYGITQWEGFSNASLNIQSQQVPFQDGAVFLDALLNQRELSVTLKMQDNGNLEERYRMRRELIHSLNPKLGEGYLIYTNDFISKRIKCVAQIPLFETHNSDTRGTPKASLSWIACEPYWEDLEETVVEYNTDELPVINNDGDIPLQVKIEIITDFVRNPKITNITNKKSICLEKFLTSTLHIDTNIGNKSIILENDNLLQISGSGFRSAIFVEDNGYYIIGNHGLILYSPDGERLIQRNSGTDKDLYAIIFIKEKNLFVAVGDSGVITTSSDNGVTWSVQTSDLETNVILYSVTYSKYLDMIIAVGRPKQGGQLKCIVTCTDGENWVSQTGSGEGVAYSEERQFFLIISSETSYMRRSTDGFTWSSFSANISNMKTITWLENEKVFVITTTDGKLYTGPSNFELRHTSSSLIYKVIYSELIHKYIGVTANTILTSNDLITWEEKAQSESIIDICSHNQKIEFLGINSEMNSIYISQDETIEKWSLIQSGFTNDFKSLFYNADYSVVVGSNGLIITNTSDIIKWDSETSNVTCDLLKIIFSKKHNFYVALGYDSNEGKVYILTSTGGKTWNVQNQQTVDMFDICYSEHDDTFVICGEDNIMTSRNCFDWIYRRSDWGGHGIIYSEKYKIYIWGYVYNLAQNDGKMRYATEIVDYAYNDITPIESTTDDVLSVAINTEGLIVGVGENGLILTSSDWTNSYRQDSGVTSNLNKVIFNEEDNKFYAVGENGVILVSPNGSDWTRIYINEISNCVLNDITVKGEDVLIVGDDGIILQTKTTYINAIQNLTPDSDMSFNLNIGENRLTSSMTEGNFVTKITFRQKYLGV